MKRRTTVDIAGSIFRINSEPTYKGRVWHGIKIEGLLLNSRMVQGIFDDLNPDTRAMWNYPDGPWDAERNNAEFLAAMPEWRRLGLLSFVINLQGGSPQGYSATQPWHNSAFDGDGALRSDYMRRLERILDKADELGMAPMLGYFYFGQDERLANEAAVIKAATNATDWLLERQYTNVLIEIANECDMCEYEHAILAAPREPELMELVRQRSKGKVANAAGRLLVSASLKGRSLPTEAFCAACDFLLLHGNGVKNPDEIRTMVAATRKLPSYRGQPIVFNEDDHFDFDKPDCNMIAALQSGASWGYFDYRLRGEGYDEGYQTVPVNWGISSARKKGFFRLLAEVTGSGDL